MTRLYSITLAFVMLTAIAASAQKEVTKSFSGIKSIRMTGSSGDCKILKSTDGTVKVYVRHSYAESEFTPTMEQSGDLLILKEEYLVRSVSGTSPRWTLTIPEGTEVRFRTGSGGLEATGMKLQLDVNTGSGSVALQKVSGEITVNTGSGDFDLEDSDGTIDVSIGSGTVRISNSRGKLKLGCGSGNIRINNSQGVFRASTGSGDVIGHSVSLEGSSNFSSGSGDAQVVLAGTLKYDIAVGSGSGDAELNFNGSEVSGEIVMVANKENGRIIAPFEFEKVEEINKGRDQVTVKKTVTKGKGTNQVRISTGSGNATLIK